MVCTGYSSPARDWSPTVVLCSPNIVANQVLVPKFHYFVLTNNTIEFRASELLLKSYVEFRGDKPPLILVA